MGLGVSAEHEAAVVRDVQPLVAIGAPRVGQLDAIAELTGGGAGCGPQPERTVDVGPGTEPMRDVAGRGQVVARAGVHVA